MKKTTPKKPGRPRTAKPRINVAIPVDLNERIERDVAAREEAAGVRVSKTDVVARLLDEALTQRGV